ncbi:hypothetical protein CesoFtcFv8_006873 [Champsocephalus esox]|uniref:Uncharacterized protein n=1 Tax=Champsocephalus esox TaxID=159716 RepID=A0AAN8CCQ1_9TELE|nr:hypothetical protein CesoFtcFv8_006873 [Champsocephalus esox]
MWGSKTLRRKNQRRTTEEPEKNHRRTREEPQKNHRRTREEPEKNHRRTREEPEKNHRRTREEPEKNHRRTTEEPEKNQRRTREEPEKNQRRKRRVRACGCEQTATRSNPICNVSGDARSCSDKKRNATTKSFERYVDFQFLTSTLFHRPYHTAGDQGTLKSDAHSWRPGDTKE